MRRAGRGSLLLAFGWGSRAPPSRAEVERASLTGWVARQTELRLVGAGAAAPRRRRLGQPGDPGVRCAPGGSADGGCSANPSGGLADAPRCGTEERRGQRLGILAMLTGAPRLQALDRANLALELGESATARLALPTSAADRRRRRRSWCLSSDPRFRRQAADIVEPVLDPPDHGMDPHRR